MNSTGQTNRSIVGWRILKGLCLCILSGLLWAGLWPFHSPHNQVRWLQKESGLVFGRYGSIFSSGTFQNTVANGDESGCLELWLEPERPEGKHVILSFDESRHSSAPFSLRQNNTSLAVNRYNIDDHGVVRTAWFEVKNVFGKDEPVVVTVNLSPRETSVYVDGSLAGVSAIAGHSDNNFSGRLVLANSPNVSDSWSGRILGLAIYRRQLSSAEVVQHYETWTRNGPPIVVQGEAPAALYLFNEREGSIVRNHVNASTNLVVPSHYMVLHPPLLASFRRTYKATWGYWTDVVINIVGFVPLGFCLFAYLSSLRSVRLAAMATIAFGFATSFTIEILQAFLPTRSSDTTDIITNTLGTVIGVALYRWSLPQSLFTKILTLATQRLAPSGAHAITARRIVVSESQTICSSK